MFFGPYGRALSSIVVLGSLMNKINDECDMEAPASSSTSLTNLRIDSETYRKITEMAYSQNTSIEKLINHMLKEQLRTMAFRRSGFILVNKQTLKDITEQVSDEELINAARNAEAHLKEVGMLVASEQTAAAKPTLTDRLNAFRFIMSLNGFPMEIASDPLDKKIRIIARMEMGRKFALYVGEAIKMSLRGFTEVDNIEVTEASHWLSMAQQRPVGR